MYYKKTIAGTDYTDLETPQKAKRPVESVVTKWTYTTPTEEGWYWLKEHKDSCPTIMLVGDDGFDLRTDQGYKLPTNAQWSKKLKEPEE